MACEKYSSWMTDAALGALAPGREPELLAHAAECAECRNACEDARRAAEFVDRCAESLVSGEPSTQFMSRLRARIAAEPVPTGSRWAAGLLAAPALAGRHAPRRSRLLSLATAAVVFSILLVVILARSPHPNHPSAPISVAYQSQPSLPQPVVTTPPPQRASDGPSRASHTLGRARSLSSRSAEPEVLVPSGQFAAVLNYAAALHSGRIDGDPLIAPRQPLDKPLEITAIEIPSLDTPNSDAGPTDSTNNSRLR